MKTSAATVLILLSIFLLVGCDQRRETQTPIDGLFGIKLGEPLPPACTNGEYYSDDGKPDKWGYQMILGIVPPQTNSAFVRYYVTLTPTNRLVCSIEGFSQDSSYEVLSALKLHYGPETSQYSNFHWWNHGSRRLTLSDSETGFTLSCDDSSLTHGDYGLPVANTNGL